MTATIALSSADCLTLVLEAVRCMTRAQHNAGTRNGAWDLLDVASALEQMLPLLRAELRAGFGGELPMSLRVELASLSRAADRAAEFGQLLTSIVPTGAPTAGSLAMHLDEWKQSAAMLMCELEAMRD